MSLYGVIRNLLFRFDAEDVHDWTVRALAAASAGSTGRSLLRMAFDLDDDRLETKAFGLTFRNPLGVAGGFDKDGAVVLGLGCLGFGHVEVGTVTPRAQPGNPRPRVHRLVDDRALVNSMGFPSLGSEAVARRLAGIPRAHRVVIGVNIGKNKDTPLDAAVEDYRLCTRALFRYADYLSINVSSPNTPDLRRLQTRESLGELLRAVRAECLVQHAATARRVPVLVKLAPDMDWADVDACLDAMLAHCADGVILTNTTTSRDGLRSRGPIPPGGLSGAPLAGRSTEFVEHVYRAVGARLPIIAAGGVFTNEDVRAKLEAGATLVQLYTGLVYGGPRLARSISQTLASSRGPG